MSKWPLVAASILAIVLGVTIGIMLTPRDSGGSAADSPPAPEPETDADPPASSTPQSSTSTAIAPQLSGIPVDGECNAVEVTDVCEPSCDTALAAMTIGTNPALGDLLVYEVGFVRLSLADGSEPEPGVSHPIDEYVVDLAARYPNDVIAVSRWGVPPPGESSQYGEGVFGLIDEDSTVSGGIEDQAVTDDAQFRVAGNRCFANEL